jgi:ABC-type nitrate/sulfonate/bicarbonate transport system substrate-binding protein
MRILIPRYLALAYLASLLGAALLLSPTLSAARPAEPALAAAALAPSDSAQLTHLVIGHSNDAPTWAPLWLADAAGVLRRYGLDAEIRSVGPGAVSAAALASGDVQVLFTGGPGAVAAAVSGSNVAIFGGYLDRMPFHLVARPDVDGVQDLRGQAVAVNAFGGASDWVLRYVLTQAGLEPDRDVRMLALGTDVERAAGLRDGTIAATILAPPFHILAEREGLRVLLDTATLPVAYTQSVMVAERPYITAHPEVVGALVQAMAEAIQLYKQDPALALPVMAAHLDVQDPELLAATWEYYRNVFSDDLEPRGLEIILQDALRQRPEQAGMRVDDLVDLRYARASRPQRETWTTLAPMPRLQQEAAAVALDDQIYVMGGFANEPEPFTLVQIYDVAANQWREGTPLPEPVHHAGAATIGGKIYLIGGFGSVFASRDPVDAVWAYDPQADRWERRAPLPAPRGALSVAVVGDRIYAVGGEHRRPPGAPPAPPGASAAYEPVADLAVYDPAADRWETLPPMRFARDHLVADGINGRLYAVSGRDRPIYDLPFVEEYDPGTRTWALRAPMPTGRSGGNGAVLGGRLFVFGGEGNPDSPLGIYSEVEAYDPATDTWTQFGPMPTPRHALATVAVGNRIYLVGGALRQGTLGPATTNLLDAFETGD